MARGDCLGEEWQSPRDHRLAVRLERLERRRRDWLDAIKCRGYVPEQDGGIVVAFVDRDPGE